MCKHMSFVCGSLGTFITVPNGHCTLLNFSLPDLTEVLILLWPYCYAWLQCSCMKYGNLIMLRTPQYHRYGRATQL